jgi:uncharacterized membrane protein YbhN (UPF0104 family)
VRATILRLGLGVAALLALIATGALSTEGLASASARPELLAGAFLALLATVPLAAFRWWLLLRALGFGLGPGWAVATTFIGTLSNTFLPGAYGGDLVRVGLAWRVERAGLNRLAVSVLADRLSGLVALLGLGLALLPALPGAPQGRLALIAGGLLLAGALGLGLGLAFAAPLAALLGRLPGRLGTTLSHITREVFGALRAYLHRPLVPLGAVAISAVQYVLVLAAIVALGRAMAFDALSAAGYAVAGVWSLVANAVPITPGGIGVGEAAFAQAAQLIAAARAPLATTEFAPLLVAAGHNAPENGHSEYFEYVLDQPPPFFLAPIWPPRAVLAERLESLRGGIAQGLAERRFDLVLANPFPFGLLPRAVLEANYVQVGAIPLDMPWGDQRWTAGVWRPRP